MEFPSHWDIVIIGGGAIGLAAAYQASKIREGEVKKRVLVLEKHNFFNQNGSSGDYVRMFRTTYTEKFLAELAIDAKKDWEELENDAGHQLISMSGLLNFGDPNVDQGPEGTLTSPITVMEELKQNYEVLNPQQIMQRYPFTNLPSNYIGVYAPLNGCINVPLTLRTLYDLAQKQGAALRSNENVEKITMQANGKVLIETMVTNTNPTVQRHYSADKIIITCGAYTNDITKHLGFEINLTIWEMASAYFTIDKMQYPATEFPSMWFHFQNNNMVYGFPELPWGPRDHVRIAVDESTHIIENPRDRSLSPSEADLKKTSEFVRQHIRCVNPNPTFMGTCLMANTHDNQFVLDFAPKVYVKNHQNIIIFTAGWAFKYAPLLGKMLADMAIKGKSDYEVIRQEYFAITRDNILKKPLQVKAAFPYSSQFLHHRRVKAISKSFVGADAMCDMPVDVKPDGSEIKQIAYSLGLDATNLKKGPEMGLDVTYDEARKFAVKAERHLKSIYGEDSRVSTIPEDWKVASKSVVSLWKAKNVIALPNNEGHVLLSLPHIKVYVEEKDRMVQLWEQERFFGEPAGAFGSGFLVNDKSGKPTLVVTAGHCIVSKHGATAASIKFVFGFDEDVIDARSIRVPKENVYEGTLIAYRLDPQSDEDWAVVRLNRPVSKKWKPATVSKDSPLEESVVHVLGHPSGLTLKYANGKVADNSHPVYFQTNLDTFGGNSGAPVFNAKGEVVGILVRGRDDYKWDNALQRAVSATYDDNEGEEDVTRITLASLQGVLQEVIQDSKNKKRKKTK